MHAFGGLYIDLDVQCFRSVEDSLLGHDIVLQSEYHGGRDIVNSIMASVPGHPFWKAIITQMLEVQSHGRPLPHASCICGLQADCNASPHRSVSTINDHELLCGPEWRGDAVAQKPVCSHRSGTMRMAVWTRMWSWTREGLACTVTFSRSSRAAA